MFVDVHTHVRSSDSSVIAIENICIASASTASLQAKQSKQRLFSMGIHPWSLAQNESSESTTLQQYQRQLYRAIVKGVVPNTAQQVLPQSIVALGEAGLDKHVDTPIEVQQSIFE